MSLSYETVEKLKEAGFPEPKVRDESQIYLTKGLMSNGIVEDIPFGAYELDTQDREYPFAYVPTLSELIDACNPGLFDDFGISTGNTDQWEAWATYAGHFSCFDSFNDGTGLNVVDLEVLGNSPEEAVAALWLDLNKM